MRGLLPLCEAAVSGGTEQHGTKTQFKTSGLYNTPKQEEDEEKFFAFLLVEDDRGMKRLSSLFRLCSSLALRR